jgi:hypothetical protein
MTSGARLTACWQRWRHDRQLLYQRQGLDLQRQRNAFFLSWERDGARYHIWIDRHSYTIEADPAFNRRPTLYMTRPQGVRVGMDGYFRTRKLDARKHGIVDTVLAHAKRAGLFEAAIANLKARERD